MKKNEEDGWHGFLQLCRQSKTLDELEEILELFLTIEERENLATRYLLIKALLERKKTQREISEELNVSISKLTRGSNALKTISSNLRRFLENTIQ